ncbi:MAG: hypothetical protein GY862_19420, partial [Gammaproteobacteria bacterium]|nr:hypothetical protein [Gammaproteobacteria bacterium]
QMNKIDFFDDYPLLGELPPSEMASVLRAMGEIQTATDEETKSLFGKKSIEIRTQTLSTH